jgi:hypothetical protein
MLVMPQKIEINWTGSNKKYFEARNYVFTGYNTTFIVDVLDLQPRRDRFVKAICSLCNTQKDVVFKFITNKRGAKYTSFLIAINIFYFSTEPITIRDRLFSIDLHYPYVGIIETRDLSTVEFYFFFNIFRIFTAK